MQTWAERPKCKRARLVRRARAGSGHGGDRGAQGGERRLRRCVARGARWRCLRARTQGFSEAGDVAPGPQVRAHDALEHPGRTGRCSVSGPGRGAPSPARPRLRRPPGAVSAGGPSGTVPSPVAGLSTARGEWGLREAVRGLSSAGASPPRRLTARGVLRGPRAQRWNGLRAGSRHGAAWRGCRRRGGRNPPSVAAD